MKQLTGNDKIRVVNSAIIIGIIFMSFMIFKRDFFMPNNLVIILIVYNSVHIIKRFFTDILDKEKNVTSYLISILTIMSVISYLVAVI